MTRIQTLLSVAAIVQGGVALALPPANDNIRNSYPYPKNDYCFQDHRSIYDILAGNQPRELANAGDPDDLGPGTMCFDPKNPPTPEVMEQVNRYISGGYTSRYQINNRWNRGGAGDPIALTWSFVPDGLVVGDGSAPGGAGASTLFSSMDARFGAANRQTWILQFQKCFDRWHALSGVSYTRVRFNGAEWDDGAAWGNAGDTTNRGDCRIGMKNIDNTNGILAYDTFPDSSDMVIDSSENWAQGAPSYLFLRDVVMHEHGHGLGLSHVCPAGSASLGAAKLMSPYIDTSFDGPQQDEIRAIQVNYGDPLEPNNSAATATVLGSLTPGTAINLGTVPSPTPAAAALLSLDSTGELDWFKCTIDVPRLINVTLTPIGSTYASSAQDTNCVGTGATTNGLAAANLGFEIRNAAGTLFWRQVNANAAGLAESVTGVLASPAGDFTIKVYQTGIQTEAQSYKISILAQNVNLAPTASDNTFSDKVRITWPNLITDATSYQITRNTTNVSTGSVQVGQVAGGVFQYDDTTAYPGTQYYYFVRAQQPGNVGYRYMTTSGDAGMRSGTNTHPTANAGPDQTVTAANNISTNVMLDGTGSFDPDGTIASYFWAEGATYLANTVSPSISLGVGVHTITLTVTDNLGDTGMDTVVITVNGPNTPPIANAGPDQTVVDGDRSGSEIVTLNGSQSSDAGGSITNYLWKEGAATLASSATATSNVALDVGTHVVTLTVTDNGGLTASDDVSITVQPGCAADFNNDGGIDGNDVEAFFNDWEQGLPSADVNNDGGVDGSDVESFFNVWSNGGC